MNMKTIIKLVPLVALLGTLGCETNGVKTVRGGDSGGYVSDWKLSAGEQRIAAKDLVGRFLNDPDAVAELKDVKHHVKGRRVIGVSEIKNKTTSQVHSNILTDNIIQALQESGKCHATATFNYNEENQDPLLIKLREARGSVEVDEATEVELKALKKPSLSLSGSITEDKAQKGRNVEKTFVVRLSVNDVNSGLSIWSGQYYMSKQGRGGIRTW